MVKLQKWSLMEGNGHVTAVVTNGGRMVILRMLQFSGGRMVMLQK